MKNTKQVAAAIAAAMALGACGGGDATTGAGGGTGLPTGGGSGGGGVPSGYQPLAIYGTGPMTIGEFITFAENNLWFTNGFTDNEIVARAPSASATYNGAVTMGVTLNRSNNPDLDTLTGRMVVTTDVAANTFNGAAGNFIYMYGTNGQPISTEQIDGNLFISGTISGTQIDGTVFGPLDGGTLSVNGTASGQFAEDNATGRSHLAGGFEGTIVEGVTVHDIQASGFLLRD